MICRFFNGCADGACKKAKEASIIGLFNLYIAFSRRRRGTALAVDEAYCIVGDGSPVPPSLSTYNPAYPTRLGEACLACLRKPANPTRLGDACLACLRKQANPSRRLVFIGIKCKNFDNLFSHDFYFDCSQLRDGRPVPYIAIPAYAGNETFAQTNYKSFFCLLFLSSIKNKNRDENHLCLLFIRFYQTNLLKLLLPTHR